MSSWAHHSFHHNFYNPRAMRAPNERPVPRIPPHFVSFIPFRHSIRSVQFEPHLDPHHNYQGSTPLEPHPRAQPMGAPHHLLASPPGAPQARIHNFAAQRRPISESWSLVIPLAGPLVRSNEQAACTRNRADNESQNV